MSWLGRFVARRLCAAPNGGRAPRVNRAQLPLLYDSLHGFAGVDDAPQLAYGIIDPKPTRVVADSQTSDEGELPDVQADHAGWERCDLAWGEDHCMQVLWPHPHGRASNASRPAESRHSPMQGKYVNAGGTTLWTAHQGKGPAVMLCSGGPGCCDYMQPVADMIDDLANVYRWEQRGCGRSGRDGCYDIATCVSDLDTLRQTFGLERWIIGGHSWGANLALAYATEHPDRVAGLMFLSGTGLDQRWKPEYRAAKEQRAELLPEMTYPPNMEVNEAGNRSYEEGYLAQPDLLERVRAVQCPGVVVHGSADLRPAWAPREVADLLPNVRFHLIDGAAHVLWLTHAAQLRSVLRSFIRDLPQS